MDIEKQFRACAKAEGIILGIDDYGNLEAYVPIENPTYSAGPTPTKMAVIYPNYDSDNDMNRLIRALPGLHDVVSGTYHVFLYELDGIITRDFYESEFDETFCPSDFRLIVTPAQKREAYLKTINSWITEEEASNGTK